MCSDPLVGTMISRDIFQHQKASALNVSAEDVAEGLSVDRLVDFAKHERAVEFKQPIVFIHVQAVTGFELTGNLPAAHCDSGRFRREPAEEFGAAPGAIRKQPDALRLRKNSAIDNGGEGRKNSARIHIAKLLAIRE